MFDINEMINESFFMSPLQRAQKDCLDFQNAVLFPSIR